MSLVGKIEGSVELDIPAAKIHDLLGKNLPQIPLMIPAIIQGIDLHEGEWGKVGSVISWRYTFDGVPKVAKEVIEEVDNGKLSITFKVIEGEVLDYYRSLNIIFQATPRDQGSVVNWTVIYEKLNENVAAPTNLLDFLVNYTKDMNPHMTQLSTEMI